MLVCIFSGSGLVFAQEVTHSGIIKVWKYEDLFGVWNLDLRTFIGLEICGDFFKSSRKKMVRTFWRIYHFVTNKDCISVNYNCKLYANDKLRLPISAVFDFLFQWFLTSCFSGFWLPVSAVFDFLFQWFIQKKSRSDRQMANWDFLFQWLIRKRSCSDRQMTPWIKKTADTKPVWNSRDHWFVF